MHISELRLNEITFTHEDDSTKELTTFAVERIAEYIKSNSGLQKYRIPVDLVHAEFIARNRGIEKHRLVRLLALDASEVNPIIVLAMPDGTHLIVDGNHRYLRAALREEPYVIANILERKDWEQFVVEGVPAELALFSLIGHSGIE